MRKISVRKTLRAGVIILMTTMMSWCALELALSRMYPIATFPYVQADPVLGVRRIPNREGRYVILDGTEVNAQWHINAQGFNSSFDYRVQRTNGPRIAVIGDSFIEALEVDPDEAASELLPDMVTCSIESYRFGMVGAALPQYYALMQEASRYMPDLYVINVVGNDFDESIRSTMNGLYWTVEVEWDDVDMMPPVVFRPDPLVRALDISPLRRYWRGNHYGWGTGGDILHTTLYRQPGTDPTRAEVEQAVLWLFEAYARFAKDHDARVLIVMEPDRSAIYGGNRPEYMSSRIFSYDEMQALVEHAASSADIDYLDLTPAFEAAHTDNPEPLNFTIDYHWNERGHAVVAQAVGDYIDDHYCSAGR